MTVATKTRRNALLNNYADELGELKAQIAALTERERDLKDLMIKSGESEIEGSLFRVTVSVTDRESFDANKARGYLTEKQIFECTRITEVTTVRCSAKTRK